MSNPRISRKCCRIVMDSRFPSGLIHIVWSGNLTYKGLKPLCWGTGRLAYIVLSDTLHPPFELHKLVTCKDPSRNTWRVSNSIYGPVPSTESSEISQKGYLMGIIPSFSRGLVYVSCSCYLYLHPTPITDPEAVRMVGTLQCGKGSPGYSHREEKQQVLPNELS